MTNKLDKRKMQMCYNCIHFDYTERKKSIKFQCGRFATALVGAGWCKFYKPTKDTDQ